MVAEEELYPFALAVTVIVIGIHDVANALLDIVIADITPSDRHTVHADNLACGLVLITEWTWQAQ